MLQYKNPPSEKIKPCFPKTPIQGHFFEKISLQIEKQLSHRIICYITYTKMVPFHILQNQNIIKDDWSTALLKKITIPYVTKKMVPFQLLQIKI